jgi:CRISPR type III-A-associated RAMP protein Csm5
MPPITEKYQNQSTTHLVEILTPVHVGTGEELVKGEDFIIQDDKVLVPDRQHLFNELEIIATQKDLKHDIEKLTKLDSLRSFVKENKHSITSQFDYRLEFLVNKRNVQNQNLTAEMDSYIENLDTLLTRLNKIHEQIKDGFWHPIIPGSSIKGAMRTALFAYLIDKIKRNNQYSVEVRSHLPSREDKPDKDSEASKKLLEHLFSSQREDTSNFDFLRSLNIADVQFKINQLNIVDVRFFNLADDDFSGLTAKWKVMKNGKNIDNWQKATSVVVEALKPNSAASLTLQIDNFLLRNPQAQKVLNWKNDLIPKNFDEWRRILNWHAKHQLIKEAKFFKKYGNENAKKECLELFKKIKKEPDAAYIRVGWGNGWKGMTGDWLDNTDKKNMRRLYDLGSRGVSEFPKTRRLIVKNGKPCLPFGWLRILSAEMSNQRLLAMAEQEIQAQEALRLEAEQVQKAQEEAKRLAEEEAKLSSEQKVIRKVENVYEKMQRVGNTATNGDLSDILSKAINQALEENWANADREKLVTLAEAIYQFQDKPSSKKVREKRQAKLQQLRTS